MSLPKAALYRQLPTEQSNPLSKNLDQDSSLAIVRKMNREDGTVASAVAKEAAHIARAVDIIAAGLKSGGRLIFVGAGTSGRLCVMEAAECPPTFGLASSKIQAVMAGGKASVFRSREGAEDKSDDGARQIARRVKPGDIVVGVAASGVTPFVQGALRAAKAKKCRTVLVTSNASPAMPKVDVAISPNVGPEIVAGSTRLKSGTAAKLVLNTLTTASMIRLGKVYNGWMVDSRPTSHKLRLRVIRMVCRLGDLRPAAARTLLRLSKGNVKTAVLAAKMKQGTGSERAARSRALLADVGGSLSLALKRLSLR